MAVLLRAGVVAGSLALTASWIQIPSAPAASTIPLRVTTAVARGGATDGAKLRLTATVEPADPQVRLTSLSAHLIGAPADATTTWKASAGGPGSWPMTLSLAALPGHYTLRISAGDVAGHTENIDVGADLGLVSAGPLKLGSLNLGVAPSVPTPTSTPGRAARGELVTPMPAMRSQFTNERDAVAFFDLYGGVANEHVSVVFEIRRRVDGPPIQLLQATIRPARVGEPDHYLVVAPIDLSQLSPGDYEVRATVSASGQAAGVITRTLRRVGAGDAIH